MSDQIRDRRRPRRLMSLRFARDGASVVWSAENAVEALVVAGVHRTRGYDFLGATDPAGALVAADVASLQSVAERDGADS